MKKRIRNTIGVILAIALCFSMLPTLTLATDEEINHEDTEQIQNEPEEEPEEPEEPEEEPETEPKEESTIDDIEPLTIDIMDLSASAGIVNHVRGGRINYGGHSTSLYSANGNTAFCLDPNLRGLSSGTYAINRFIHRGTGYDLLMKSAFYLYGGPGYNSVKHSLFGDPDSLTAYGLSHAAISFVWSGNEGNAFMGLDSATRQHLKNVISSINALPMPSGFTVFIYNEGSSTFQTFLGWEYAPPGDLEIRKVSSNPDMSSGSSLYSLEGAIFDVFNGSNQKLGSITTNVNGRGRLNNIEAGQTGLYIVETKPPKGFAENRTRIPFEIISGQTVTVTISNRPQNDPVGIILRKLDNETNKPTPQGGALLEGAEFTLKFYNEHYTTESQLRNITPQRTWVLRTDKNGVAFLHKDYLVSGDPFYYAGNGDPTLPLGTLTIQETKAPEGYLINNELFIRQITSNGVAESVRTYNAPIVPEQVMRGDLRGVKISDGNAHRMANVPFRITSKTTGENHVIVTDKNGEFNTHSSWNPHSQNTNRGETSQDGIWFGDIDALDDNKGALIYDTYIIQEERCEANQGRELFTFEISVYRNNHTINLGTLTNELVPIPEISTTAIDKETEKNIAYTNETTTIIDTIYYSGLKSGKLYTLKGILMDKETEEPIIINDNQVTAATTFRAFGETGATTMEFTLDSTTLQGKTIVVFQYLYEEDTLIAEHTDINDERQTITFKAPTLKTTATGINGEKELDIKTEVKITDKVQYENLIPNETYTIKGILIDKATGKPIEENGKQISAQATFKPNEETGTIDVTFTLNSTTLIGKTIVVFEYLYYKDRLIAEHTDINDENQTITFKVPKIKTTATGKDGNKIIPLDEKAVIIDTVSYENLTPNQEYTIKGILMDKETGKSLEITAETTFTPTEATGTIEVIFTLDSTKLEGKTIVVFEYLYYKDTLIADHTDINDEAQTVTVESKTPEPPTPTNKSPQTGQDGLPLKLLAICIGMIILAIALTIYTKKRWKDDKDE